MKYVLYAFSLFFFYVKFKVCFIQRFRIIVGTCHGHGYLGYLGCGILNILVLQHDIN